MSEVPLYGIEGLGLGINLLLQIGVRGPECIHKQLPPDAVE
jgi:hypothetical protein